MSYEKRIKEMELELEVRRSVYCSIVSDMLSKKDYEDMEPQTKLELITIIKSFNKLANKYQS